MSGFLDLMGATAGALALIDRLAENPASRKGSSMYRGKYPNRIREVFTKNGVACVTTNDGARYAIKASQTGDALPKVGRDVSEYFTNPRTRKTAKRAPIKRAGLPAKKYAMRPSQITRAKPSKRLKARRAAHIASGMPAGVFPNPLVMPKTVYSFVVQSAKAENGPWKTHTSYPSQAKAFDHARLIAKAEPTWWVRVQSKTEKFKGSIHG